MTPSSDNTIYNNYSVVSPTRIASEVSWQQKRKETQEKRKRKKQLEENEEVLEEANFNEQEDENSNHIDFLA